jgi:acid phosphatase (class B)
MKRSRTFVSSLLLFFAVLIYSPAVSFGDCTCLTQAGGRLITVETLSATLPDHPIIVGFDVDDTVLFSSPGFNYGMNNTDAPGGKNIYGEHPLDNDAFWKEMNQQYDKFSLPKEIGVALINMHKKRGDRLLFITKRRCGDHGKDKEALRNRLEAIFKLKDTAVFCDDDKSKTDEIEKKGVDIYYGDSDTDVQEARAAKPKMVRPIRIKRSPMSTNKTGYKPGAFCEEVLVNSEN